MKVNDKTNEKKPVEVVVGDVLRVKGTTTSYFLIVRDARNGVSARFKFRALNLASGSLLENVSGMTPGDVYRSICNLYRHTVDVVKADNLSLVIEEDNN